MFQHQSIHLIVFDACEDEPSSETSTKLKHLQNIVVIDDLVEVDHHLPPSIGAVFSAQVPRHLFLNIVEEARKNPIVNVYQPYPVSEKDRKSTRLNSSHGYISYAVF